VAARREAEDRAEVDRAEVDREEVDRAAGLRAEVDRAAGLRAAAVFLATGFAAEGLRAAAVFLATGFAAEGLRAAGLRGSGFGGTRELTGLPSLQDHWPPREVAQQSLMRLPLAQVEQLDQVPSCSASRPLR
jgi:hypothetical protein